MCVRLSTEISEIFCENSTTTCCLGAASGKLFSAIISQMPHMHHRYFRKCGAPDDGPNDISSIDKPIENFIFISVGSVLRELQ
jgi:hypothetical protein